MEFKRASLFAALLVSLMLGMAASLASTNAFPGIETCGSGCDLQILSRTLLVDYGIHLELLSLVLAAAVIGALTLAKAEKEA